MPITDKTAITMRLSLEALSGAIAQALPSIKDPELLATLTLAQGHVRAIGATMDTESKDLADAVAKAADAAGVTLKG